MTPTRSSSSVLSRDDATDLYAPTLTSEPGRQPVRTPFGPTFELRCADVQPYRCEETLRARNPRDVVALACEHGARVHGFTPVWYSAERLTAMAAAVDFVHSGA
jgi:hypothetical protein